MKKHEAQTYMYPSSPYLSRFPIGTHLRRMGEDGCGCRDGEYRSSPSSTTVRAPPTRTRDAEKLSARMSGLPHVHRGTNKTSSAADAHVHRPLPPRYVYTPDAPSSRQASTAPVAERAASPHSEMRSSRPPLCIAQARDGDGVWARGKQRGYKHMGCVEESLA